MPQVQQLPDVRDLLSHAVEALGGSERSGQLDMADAVRDAIRTGEHLAVQAGTGTGKSLAYLVPAIQHAIESGTTVVVSTATIALQRQLVERDLPRLTEALREPLGRKPTFAILKGRRNYLCLHRLDGGDEEDSEPAALFDPGVRSKLETEIRRLREWSSETETGDRDDLVPGVSDRAWRQASVSAKECLGVAKCPVGADCFAEQARSTAGHADVVVTNHALLAIDAMQDNQIMPEHDVVVIDEAHDLVDRVTSASSAELTTTVVATAARRCGRIVDEELADRLSEAGEGLGLVLDEMANERLDSLPQALAGALAATRDAAHACLTALGTERKEDPQQASGRKLAESALDEVHTTAMRVLDAFGTEVSEQRDVVWRSGDPQASFPAPPTLHVAPLSVSGLLRERVFGQHTAVLTSATLALGGSFEPLARQWGLPPANESPTSEVSTTTGTTTATAKSPPDNQDTVRWNAIDVGSPFDHKRNGILYVAKHLPPPGREGIAESTLDELAELIDAAGGRTLGLFSAMRAARQASEALRDRIDHPILCQGDDSTGLLIEQFASDPRTCLFGTLSLWQGVDVPGPELQLVVVDRLPFPRPDDPVASARSRAVTARGGNGFMTVSASHAALLLAQGTGRLHRTGTDRGVIAVLDSRLATARYASFLRASLPPFWPTVDPHTARDALRRLDAADPG